MPRNGRTSDSALPGSGDRLPAMSPSSLRTVDGALMVFVLGVIAAIALGAAGVI